MSERVGKEMSASKLPDDIPLPITDLINKYPDTFPAEYLTREPQQQFVHHIHLQPNSTPYARNPYRFSQPELAELRTQIEALLPTGRIRPSSSPFGAPVLFAKKKDGGLRFCVDYRALNKMTIKDKYPLPRVEDLLDRLATAKVFSGLDCASGFWQMPLAEEDKHKSAFITPLGQFEWNVMHALWTLQCTIIIPAHDGHRHEGFHCRRICGSLHG